MERKQEVSKAVIQRLPRYYRNICELKAEGEQRISSKALAERMGLTASQIRQDFNCFGGYGQQGYGYLFWGGPQAPSGRTQVRPAVHPVPGQGRGHHRGGGVPGCPLPDGRHFRRTVSPAVRRRGLSINKKAFPFREAFCWNASARRSSPGLCPGSVYRQTAPAGSLPHR